MVAPDRHVGDIVDGRTSLLGDLRHGSVVIETHHGRELLRVEIWRRSLGDQSVGVGRVSDNQNLHVLAGVVVDGLALRAENATVGFEKVGALHSVLARHGAYEQAIVGIGERNVCVIGLDHSGK